MAITNTDLPEKVSLMRSPVLAKLTSSLQVVGDPADYIKINVGGNPTLGETIQITYGDLDETLTIQNAADASGLTLSRQTTLTLAEYAELLAEEFQRNYQLFSTFLIEYVSVSGSEFVQLTPRTGGLTPTVTDTATNWIASIVAYTLPDPPVNPAVTLLVEVYDNVEDQWLPPVPHVLPILRTGEELVFEIQKDFNLRHHLPPRNTIGIGGSYFTACTDNWARYRMRYAEQEGRPPVVTGLMADEDRYALFGGNAFLNQYAAFWTFWKDNGRFLTSQSAVRTITYDQPEWLYWVGRRETPRVGVIYVQAFQRSGTITTYERGSYTLNRGEVTLIKTGFMQLGLPDIPADPIVKYKVSLQAAAANISEVITYLLTGECGEPQRYFLFGNSLGGCDTVRAMGKFVTRIEASTQEASRIVTESVLEEGRGQTFDYDRRVRGTYEGSVGYRSAAYIAYLQDLLESPEVWMIDVSGTRFSPVQIDTGSYDLLKDGEDLYTLRFRYRHSWEDNSLGVSDGGQRIIVDEGPGDGEDIE